MNRLFIITWLCEESDNRHIAIRDNRTLLEHIVHCVRSSSDKSAHTFVPGSIRSPTQPIVDYI